MLWDFAESNCFSNSSGNFEGGYNTIANAVSMLNFSSDGSIEMADASGHDPVAECLISTDPPYYDNVPYADLSDFFYVWLRSILQSVFPREFATFLVPKIPELIAEPARHRSSDEAERFFVEGMTKAISRMVRLSDQHYPAAIYYAFKQAEAESQGVLSTGWATFLDAVILSSYQVDGTWPIRTELARRVRGQNSNALASSIVLVCRRRAANAPSVTRGDFLRAVRAELPAALHTLQESAIAPVDMAQASIGPGMAVFSRYKEVLEADDTRMSVREALRIINAELDAFLAEQEGDYDSWTRFAVTWFHQHGFEPGRFGDAETLAKARDVSVDGVRDAGIIERKAGKVWLLRRNDLPRDYLPFMDNRQTVWEGCQHLIKRLEGGSEVEAARLAKQLGYQADMARDLAYRLYQICERNKWAEEARAYNGLIESWREIIKIRDGLPDETTAGPAQAELAV
jgi:putative DNA methylase